MKYNMEKIKSISEAFSMQPVSLMVCTAVERVEHYPKYKIIPHEHNEFCIKEIVFETRRVDSDEQCNYCVGYDFRNRIMFEYLQSSVNINYENK